MHTEEKRTRNLTWAFWGFDFLFFAAAVALIVISFVFEQQSHGKAANGKGPGPHTMRSLIITELDCKGALILGAVYISAVVFSVPAFLTSKRRTGSGAFTSLLVAFNGYLIVTLCATVAVGLAVWFATLREQTTFLNVWNAQPPTIQAVIQDTLQCCGWFNATSSGLFTAETGFCANVANVTADPCAQPFVNFADRTLNDAFTVVFGFSGIQAGLFLASVCLLNDRHEVERYRRIDEKRGVTGQFV